MDNLTMAQKIFANNPKEEIVNKENSSSASIVYMVAVTSSSGGEVVLRNETESSAEWEEDSYLEIDDEGDFEEYEDEDALEDIDDSVIDLTDGDGVDIEGDDANTVAFTVAKYKSKAIQVYATEVEVEEDPLEDGEVSDEIDDGDAEEVPEEDAKEDPVEDGEITELDDEDYNLVDANEDDESDVIEDAEVSDGYTVAECIGAVNEGDRVAVAVQNGKLIVLGVVGSGDQQRAATEESQKTADEALEDVEKTKELVEAAENAAEQAAEKAALAESSANQAVKDAQDAKLAAATADEKAESVAGNAQAAIDTANEAKGEAESASGVANAAKADAAKALEDAANVAKDVGNLESTLASDYTKKTEFASVKTDFETRITQNANDISLSVKKITEIDETANNAKELANRASAKAEEAKSKAELADTDAKAAKLAADNASKAATDAQTKAETAQQAADDAKTAADTAEEKLAEAQAELEAVQGRVGVTEQEIADAQAKVDNAQTAADKAQTDATNAQLAADAAKSDAAKAQTAADAAKGDASKAQAAADAAKEVADKAQADADALAKKVTTVEADIVNLGAQIDLTVKKLELTETLGGYYTKVETDSKIKVESESISQKVSAEVTDRQNEVKRLEALLEVKVNTEDLISEINASADVINLTGGRIIIDSENFKVAQDGTITAKNGNFTGTITGSSGEFTKDFKVNIQSKDKNTFLMTTKYDDDAAMSYLEISCIGVISGWSNLFMDNSSIELGASSAISISAEKTLDLQGLTGGVTISNRSARIVVDDNGVAITGGLKVDGTQVSLNGHTHSSLYNSALGETIAFTKDGDYGYFRPSVASLVYCGTSARPWYKVYTERLEVLTNRPTMQPVYDNTVSYETNCYISSAGLLSRTTKTSSRTIKHDIKAITDSDIAPERLYDVGIYQFRYNDGILTDKTDSRFDRLLPGFIIEELAQQYPIAVDQPSDNVKEWSWNAQYLIPPMLKLIQNQHEADEQMKRKLAEQESRIEQLTSQVQQLIERMGA